MVMSGYEWFRVVSSGFEQFEWLWVVMSGYGWL